MTKGTDWTYCPGVPVKTPVPNWLEPHLATCEAIVALFAPYAEVAVHDIRRDRIVGIWNPISARKLGDPSLIAELPPHSGTDRVIGPYPKVLADGRQVTSVSVVLQKTLRALLGAEAASRSLASSAT